MKNWFVIKFIFNTGLIPYMNEGIKVSNDKKWFDFIEESTFEDEFK